MATVAIGGDDDQFGYGLCGDQRVCVLARFTGQEPITGFAGRAVEGVEDRVVFVFARGRVIGGGQVDFEGTALIVERGADVAAREDRAGGFEERFAVDIDIGREDEEIDRVAGEEDQGEHAEGCQPAADVPGRSVERSGWNSVSGIFFEQALPEEV